MSTQKTTDEWIIEVYYSTPQIWRTWYEESSRAFMEPTDMEWCIALLADRKKVYEHLKMEEYRFTNVRTGERIPAAVLGL